MELTPIFPDKEFFSIGEASRLSQLPAYVLRYWESEFKQLRPARRNSGQRKYTKKDLELIFQIKGLLYERKFTIAGARKALFGRKKTSPEEGVQLNMEVKPQDNSGYGETIAEAKKELEELLELLK
ncbi:MAG TPA: MerR family transcriptional regulator [Elusimicrobia bacterium]|nr:MAG: hypothetical protein A2278_03885 [Elusimicrobia bacterium RIFOXYA12_FULL_49_49]OGS10072.1 MAG: hypothetical protein A2204_07905 [Elusimicrobia bacterium RIFOXYA1_FULL_47_7]OGS15300.1 MAG: hypothetical protein A2251_07200 [Elusimicrobia bacterium RIFOXYA2_FULL_47_53]OGS26546.1 MAG: hypothetical protein A2339_06920 [Elusimicrobia bacterium RIFOXYB12_FULL_50_12]OGS30555.1 MAG: hypothetical protein A2323_02320 [Elusimicrobia bacterium RIFOXYB2_FULL_46_23]HBU68977.1 MerR family transcriptio